MKIGIEGQRLFRKKKHGMDMVALELIKNLQLIDTKNEYVIFVKPDQDSNCIPSAPNFRIIELKGGFYPFWEQIALPLAAAREGCQVLHCTSNTAPIFSKVPLVTIIHDIIYLEQVSLFRKGGSLYQKFGNMYRRWVVPIIARKSKVVTTVSEYEKERIGGFLNLKANLKAVYNGVGSHFKKITDQSVLDATKIKYKLPDTFLFFLGNTDPKKNTPNVLKAFALFNKTSEIKYKLVMLDYDEQELMKTLREIGHPELRKDIIMTGYVPNAELPAIINQCEVFLYPSLRESFGIPILEGMACGVPVVTSNTSSMPEIAGDAAFIVDPTQPEAIAAAVRKIIENDAYRNELCNKGIQRASLFSWKAMAIKYLEIYKEVSQPK
jgi:glycosyltransferase involved in cell wall biosynthesis